MKIEVNIAEGRGRSCGLLAASFTLGGDINEKGPANIIYFRFLRRTAFGSVSAAWPT